MIIETQQKVFSVCHVFIFTEKEKRLFRERDIQHYDWLQKGKLYLLVYGSVPAQRCMQDYSHWFSTVVAPSHCGSRLRAAPSRVCCVPPITEEQYALPAIKGISFPRNTKK